MRWLGNLLHFLWVAIIVLVATLLYGLGRLGTLFVWGRARRARAVGALRGWILRQAMTALGATFIKMGQVMSTRPDLFAPEVIAQLRRLQDRLPPFSFRHVRRTLEEDLGRPLGEVFAELDERPVAAASVAQVHRARRLDGREVAVKVLRPHVRRQVERDAALLLGGARVLALSRQLRLSDPVGHTRQFVDAIHDQTDLSLEAANYTRFRGNFAAEPRVAFPEVHADLSSRRVLTMEFMRGVKIDALPPGDHRALAATMRGTIFKMCFEDGFVHADLHPGNLLVDERGRLVIFDVGLAKLLEGDVLAQFIDMTKCLTMGTPDDLIAHLQRFHRYLGDVDWPALRVEVDELARRFRAKNAGSLEYGELLGEMFALGRKYEVRPITDMMLVFVALITAQGIGKMLEPDHNVFASVARYLLPVLMRRNEAVPETPEALAAGAAKSCPPARSA